MSFGKRGGSREAQAARPDRRPGIFRGRRLEAGRFQPFGIGHGEREGAHAQPAGGRVPRQHPQGVGPGLQVETPQEVDAAPLHGLPPRGEIDFGRLQERGLDSAAGAQGVEGGLDPQRIPGLAGEQGRTVHPHPDQDADLALLSRNGKGESRERDLSAFLAAHQQGGGLHPRPRAFRAPLRGSGPSRARREAGALSLVDRADHAHDAAGVVPRRHGHHALARREMEGEAVAGGLSRSGEQALVGDLDRDLGGGHAGDLPLAIPRRDRQGEMSHVVVLLRLHGEHREGQARHRRDPQAAVLLPGFLLDRQLDLQGIGASLHVAQRRQRLLEQGIEGVDPLLAVTRAERAAPHGDLELVAARFPAWRRGVADRVGAGEVPLRAGQEGGGVLRLCGDPAASAGGERPQGASGVLAVPSRRGRALRARRARFRQGERVEGDAGGVGPLHRPLDQGGGIEPRGLEWERLRSARPTGRTSSARRRTGRRRAAAAARRPRRAGPCGPASWPGGPGSAAGPRAPRGCRPPGSGRRRAGWPAPPRPGRWRARSPSPRRPAEPAESPGGPRSAPGVADRPWGAAEPIRPRAAPSAAESPVHSSWIVSEPSQRARRARSPGFRPEARKLRSPASAVERAGPARLVSSRKTASASGRKEAAATLVTSAGRPSSRTLKSSRVRPWTGLPSRSVTSTSTSATRTSRDSEKAGSEAGGWARAAGRKSRAARPAADINRAGSTRPS